MDPESLIESILKFRDARDWKQFHTPKNLAAALAIESAELQELFLWKTDEEVSDYLDSDQGRSRLEEELADTFIYCLLLAETTGVDPAEVIRRKLEVNDQKYPADLAKGRAAKYTEL